MARFITTTEISHQIESLIKESKTYIVIVSPFLQIADRLKAVIKHKVTTSKVPFFMAYKDVEAVKQLNWLNTLPNTKTFHVKNLHAKCYMNESKAVISSLNLYEFSMINNVEFGVLIEDLDNLFKIHDECNQLFNNELPTNRIKEASYAKELAKFDLSEAMKSI